MRAARVAIRRAPLQEPPTTSFKDRSVRLSLFGLGSVLVGAGLFLIAALHLLLPLTAGRVSGLQSVPADWRSAILGAATYALLGSAFAWVGVGSMRRRRWARPLMLTLAWTWLLGGVVALFTLPGLFDLALGVSASGGAGLDAGLAGMVRLALMGGVALGGVLLPSLFIWAYNDRQMKLTCEAHDARPDWTERCPPSVLGLSVGLAGCGALLALMALRPALPLFGRLLTGWPGSLGLVVAGGVCVWLAREIYRLRDGGWWATTVFLVLVGVSTSVTLLRVSTAELLLSMGFPDDALPAGDSGFGRASAWASVAFTLATVAYMAGIRKHFKRPG